jgi:hypothetical protein
MKVRIGLPKCLVENRVVAVTLLPGSKINTSAYEENRFAC